MKGEGGFRVGGKAGRGGGTWWAGGGLVRVVMESWGVLGGWGLGKGWGGGDSRWGDSRRMMCGGNGIRV